MDMKVSRHRVDGVDFELLGMDQNSGYLMKEVQQDNGQTKLVPNEFITVKLVERRR